MGTVVRSVPHELVLRPRRSNTTLAVVTPILAPIFRTTPINPIDRPHLS